MKILERIDPMWRRICAVTAFSVAGALASCSADDKPRGQLMVAISTDLSIIKDMDQVQLEVFGSDGTPLASNSYDIRGIGLDGRTLVDGLHMPGTVAIVPPDSGGQRVRVRVTAKSTLGGTDTPRIVREAILKIPQDRVALLQMPLRWLCKDQLIPAETPQAYESTCSSHDSHSTCGGGDCIHADIDTNALPDYSPKKVFGGGDAHGKGSTCIDVPHCFGEEPTVDLRKSDCSVALPANADPKSLNVAMVLPPNSDGHCLDTPDGPKTGQCYLPLDVDAEEAPTSDAALSDTVHEGFFVRGDRIYLPRAVCNRQLVQGVAVSLSCKTKDLSIPVCGPWTGWPQAAPPSLDGGPPPSPDGSPGGGATGGGGGGVEAGGASGSGGTGGMDGGMVDGGPQFCTEDAVGAPGYYYVFVDRTASMGQAVTAVDQALQAFVSDPKNSGIPFGLQLSSQQQACSPNYSTPAIPLTPLPSAANLLQQIQPTSFRSVLLDSAIGQSLVTVEAPSAPASRTLVVITAAHDDPQTGCGTSTDLMKQTVSKALADGVSLRPIVVTGADPSNLAQGFQGTGTPQAVQLNGASVDQLTASIVQELDKYRDEIALCTYVAPATSYTVQLVADGAGGATTPLTKVGGAAACKSNAQYYEPTPGVFTLCPTACTAAAGARVETTVRLEDGVDAAGCGTGGKSGGGGSGQGGGSGTGFQVQCPLQQQGMCYVNTTTSPVDCTFSPTCSATIQPGMSYCPNQQCSKGGGGATGAGGASTGGAGGAGGGRGAQNCTTLDACCQSLTNAAMQTQCQTTVKTGNDTQCRSAITTGGFCSCAALDGCCATLTGGAQQQCAQAVSQADPNGCTSALGAMCGCGYMMNCCQNLTDVTQQSQCLSLAQRNVAMTCAQNAPLYCPIP